jgi:protein SCO1/2
MVFSRHGFSAIVVGAAILAGTGTGTGMAATADPSDRGPAAANSVSVSTAEYRVPDVTLVRDDGRRVSILEEMDDGRPVFVNFIFTSCPGICPLMSETFRQLQVKLGDARSKVHMVSISIDPEADTPQRLREYAGQFRAGLQWQHYTGTVEASLAVQRAFGVYNGDKMNHAPVTFFRAAPGRPWTRLKGFATTDDLIHVYKTASMQLAASR